MSTEEQSTIQVLLVDDHDMVRMGLSVMRERAALIGASIEVTSAEGQGTHIRVAFPLP